MSTWFIRPELLGNKTRKIEKSKMKKKKEKSKMSIHVKIKKFIIKY